MNDRHQFARLPVLLISIFLLGACAAPVAEVPTSQGAAVGRVVDIQVTHGYLIAEFPSGRMYVGMDKRELGWYIVGDQIRIDTFGRPLPYRVAR